MDIVILIIAISFFAIFAHSEGRRDMREEMENDLEDNSWLDD